MSGRDEKGIVQGDWGGLVGILIVVLLLLILLAVVGVFN